MQSLHHFFFPLFAAVFIFSLQSSMADSNESSSSIYDVLKNHGLPKGLLPKGVKNFSLDNSGNFEVHLDQACNAKFENELHYDMNVTGTLRYGQIDGLSGISTQDLFLWFPVIEIRVDVPSSGLIYFDVGVVSKQFSLSSFETPRDCLAVTGPDLRDGKRIVESVSKVCMRLWSRDQSTCSFPLLSSSSYLPCRAASSSWYSSCNSIGTALKNLGENENGRKLLGGKNRGDGHVEHQ